MWMEEQHGGIMNACYAELHHRSHKKLESPGRMLLACGG
jgi:hypothetical protein